MPAKVSVPVPDSLSSLLHRFRSCFTAPGFEVFTAMFTGFIFRPVERTARVLVEANWPVIEALADAVTEAGSLTWQQALPVVRAACLRMDVKPAGTG